MTETEITVGNYTIRKGSTNKQRLAAIFWGKAGDGKTTLAATARGNKLWLQFDPEGTASVVGLEEQVKANNPTLDTALKNEIYVLDLSKETNNFVAKFDQPDAFGITPFITNPDYNIKTIVVDSLTSLGDEVLKYKIKFGGFKGSSLDTPGFQAYGARLSNLKAFIQGLLKLTGKYDLDIIFISHEKAPETNDDGAVVEITLALGGNLPNESALQVGEVWYIRNSAVKGREIFIKPFQSYRPMKTRMFSQTDSVFKWDYDVEKPNPKFELATWMNDWEKSGYQKLGVPK